MPPRAPPARRLEGSRTVVSRDEYHGIAVERAKKVRDALGVWLVTCVEVKPMRAVPRVRGKPGQSRSGDPRRGR